MSNSTFDLSTLGILRPDRIRWMHDTPESRLIDTIRSKSLKTFLIRVDDVLAEAGITVEHLKLDLKHFSDWLDHYDQFTAFKGYDRIASIEWFNQKPQENKEVFAFLFRHNNELCGSLVYTLQANQKAFASYKTNLDDISPVFKKHHSLGAVIDYYFLRAMREQHIPWISLGTMRNAFGVINSLGNLDYKLRMGYQPIEEEKAQRLSTVPLNDQREVSFFGLQKDKLHLYTVALNGSFSHPEISRFNSDKMKVVSLS